VTTPLTDDKLRRRLERLVVQFLGLRLKTPESLWEMQLALLDQQRDVQKAITASLREPKGKPRHTRLTELRETLWHARRFGDAIAWVLFKRDARAIFPLSYNAKVPVPPESHGAHGVVVAAHVLSERFGLPLLHDITDLLRVGDVTFFKRDERPHTIEVKTEVGDITPDGDGYTKVSYHDTAIWPADGSIPREVRRSPTRKPQAAMTGDSFARQLRRLSRASAMATAEPGKPVVIEGKQALIIQSKTTPPDSYWPLIRRLIRQARRTGYASGAADDTVMYVVVFSKSGLDDPNDITKPAGPDLLESGILMEGSPNNVIRILGLPTPQGQGPHRYTPYYLYDLPRAWIVDILRGRLIVLAVVNVGPIAAALEQAGLRTELGGQGSYVRVFCDVETEDGKYLVELAPLNENITEIIMEAMPLRAIVSHALEMADAIKEQLPSMIRMNSDQETPEPIAKEIS
jgi:hypothetical protein